MSIETVLISTPTPKNDLFKVWGSAFEQLKRTSLGEPTVYQVGAILLANLLEEPTPDWQRDPMGIMPFFPSVQDYRCEAALLLRAIASWIDLG